MILWHFSAIVAFWGEGNYNSHLKIIRKYQNPCKFSVDVVVGVPGQSSYFRT